MLLQHGSPEDAFWLVVALVKKYDFSRYFSWNRGKGQAIDAVAFRDLLDSSDSKLGKRLVRLSLSSVCRKSLIESRRADGYERPTRGISRQLVVDTIHPLPPLRHLVTALRLFPLRPKNRLEDFFRHPRNFEKTSPR